MNKPFDSARISKLENGFTVSISFKAPKEDDKWNTIDKEWYAADLEAAVQLILKEVNAPKEELDEEKPVILY